MRRLSVVRAALLGLDGIDWFQFGSAGKDETNIGVAAGKWPNMDAVAAFEEAAKLAGTTLTRVSTGMGERWRVEGHRPAAK